ncbi:MAG: tetratricopeptide repeat protein [Anaerolineae bacterium]|nr:tetratricopeptide repeat protein [Anaerolineae bacterium]
MDIEQAANHDELDEQRMATESPGNHRPSPGLIWRVGVAVAALVIIAILAYPWIQELLKNDDSRNVPAQPATIATTVATAPEATVQANPNSAEAWFELGKVYYSAEQWNQAGAAFQKAIELDPGFQAAYANLGATYHRQERLDLAVLQYEQALELNPDDGEVIYNLAAAYIQQGAQGGQPDPDLLNKAITQLQHALELSPAAAEPYFGLGVAYMVLNQRAEAISAFETFLTRDSGQDPRATQEAQRYLEMLRGQ